jgi:hypothetical protein
MNHSGFDQIIYFYGDSPMPTYVDYQIRVTAEQVVLAIEGMQGKGEFSYSLSGEQFASLIASFEKHDIGYCEREEFDEPCSGGTTDTIICKQGGETVFSGSVYHCGGTDQGTLCGDIDAFRRDIEQLVPDLNDQKMKHGSW